MRIVNFRYGIASEDFGALCKELSSKVDKEIEKYRAIADKSDPGYTWGLLQGGFWAMQRSIWPVSFFTCWGMPE